MKNDHAVFCSDITKSGSESKNNLYDLLNIVPAKPIPSLKHQDETNQNETPFSFTPYVNKRYISQKPSKLKVRTVRDIRALYEQDVTCDLPLELEKQKNYLMKKIRYGFSTNEHTKHIASSMLNGDKPISTSAWQMLANINPHNQKFPKQFVLWNGRRIQVNGSKGGKTKFICNYDLEKNKSQIKKISNFTNSVLKRKVGLLRNSLKIKFKPGPLQKKKFLDDSNHKYHMGDVELIPLPKPVLDIFPSYGAAVDPAIAAFINSLREESGLISPKWADYAVSVLGTLTNNSPAQLDNESCISFDINYNHGQNRLLMRRNNVDSTQSFDSSSQNANSNPEIFTMTEVQEIVEKMIDSVEISLMQEDLYLVDDLKDTKIDRNENEEINLNTKDKSKKSTTRCSELNRLDVTVINIPQMSQKADTKPCGKYFCTLGCICDSINCSYNLRQHCGVLDCMFGCKCDLSKFEDIDLLERSNPEIIPGLFRLDNQLNSHLAKEEQEFHQTVIVSGEKSILLKSRKRKCKTTTKYAEYYSKINLQNENSKRIPVVEIVDISLSCKNIEPLCMVHNLYKCFCKGKFSESSHNYEAIEKNETVMEETKSEKKCITTDINTNPERKYLRKYERQRRITNVEGINSNKSLRDLLKQNTVVDLSFLNYDTSISQCARTNGYNGRKYSDGYYKNTNLKIMEMEENDELLKIKMRDLVGKANNAELISCSQKSRKDSESESEDIHLYYDESSNDSDSKTPPVPPVPPVPLINSNNKYNIKAWLEYSYRIYRQRRAQGLRNNILKRPEKGASCMLSWEALLSRYRDRKNLFFVTKQPPHRTFLSVNLFSPIYKNCVKLEDVHLTDLSKYPPIVQNLVANETEKNNRFCMLRGWSRCWELIGSAVRMVESDEQPKPSNSYETEGSGWLTSDSEDWQTDDTSTTEKPSVKVFSSSDNSLQGRSKWFVMKIENDFNEIQFSKKGFFVTYEGIQRSIRLARLSGKTVRLSSQARPDKNSTTQFGIYAIPSTKESCVFIGPYEENESLGIETVKTSVNNKKQEKTRGVWIITNKIDNINVIDNPLSFMPTSPTVNEEISFEPSVNISLNDTKEQHVDTSQKLESANGPAKMIKPITIRRTNIIQKLPSKNELIKGPISLLTSNAVTQRLDNENYSASTSVAYVKPFVETAKLLNDSDEVMTNTSNTTPRPVAEIAPNQIKITRVFSKKKLNSSDEDSPNKSQGSTRMMILKPDEINKRIGITMKKLSEHSIKSDNVEASAADVEGFLEQSPICACPEDILVISDTEGDNFICKSVWIQCSNIPEFGHFPGTRKGNMLSFKIPGFNYSEFYTQSEAFTKINQLLERKIYIPKFVTLKWTVVEVSTSVTSHLLTTNHLSDKKYLFNLLRIKRNLQGYTGRRVFIVKPKKDEPAPSTSTGDIYSSSSETISLIEDLEETSNELENTRTVLFNEAVRKQIEIGNSLAVPDNLQAEMTGKLQDMFDSNNE